MSQQNKIDFTVLPEESFLNETEHMDEHFRQFSIISDIQGKLENYNGFIVGLVTFMYFRINGANAKNKLRIPVNASFDNLTYKEGQNLFIDIFNRYKIICEANALLDETATILERDFIDGAEKLSVEFQKDFAKELVALDWSESGFTNQDCGLFVEGTLIRESLVTEATDSIYPDLYIHAHHLKALLNIRPNDKQLCTPILYNTYLVHLLEQLGWPKNNCEKLVKKHLVDVAAVQTDPVLWAVHTIEAVLFGCEKQLISKAEDLLTIHNKADGGYDVIFLPEANNDSIPDVGPITIGNSKFVKFDEDGDCSNNLYYVAFLYNLLNDRGRMLVRFDEKYETALRPECSIDGVYDQGMREFFVENNLIEAVIQTKNCTYLLIDKNRPDTRHDRILFYYAQEFGFFAWGQYCANNQNLAKCIKEYSSENIKIKHDEGVCLVSNKEIAVNDYCLLPKKYIYDFDRIIANAEFHVVSHLAHNLSSKLNYIDSVLQPLTYFMELHSLSQEPLQEQSFEGQVFEPVGEAISKASRNVAQMHKIIEDTRKVITEEISQEEFRIVNLRGFLEATKKKYESRIFTLHIECDQGIEYKMHESTFGEMIDNFIRNAEIHGFVKGSNRAENEIVISVIKNNSELIVEIKNNGEQQPDELTVDKFIGFGNKGKNSPGDGLGGAYIYKVIRAHRGALEIICDNKKEKLVVFKITLPHLEGNK